MIQTIKKLLYIIPASKISLLGIIILFIFSSVLEVIGIGSIGSFVNLVEQPKNLYKYSFLEKIINFYRITDESRFIAFLGIIVIVLFCAKVFIAWLTQAYIFNFCCKQQRVLISKILDQYLSAPYTYHLDKNSAYIIEQVIEIADRFHVILEPLFVGIVNLFIIISLLALLWFLNSSMLLILLVILLPFFVAINSFKRKVKAWGKQNRRSKAKLIETINYSLGGIKETKIIGCENYFKNQVLLIAHQIERSLSNYYCFSIMPRFLFEAVMLIYIVGLISYYLLIGNDTNQLQSILAVYALAAIRFLPAFSQAVGSLNSLRNNSYTVDQIYFDIKDLKRETKNVHKQNLNIYNDINTKPIKQLAFEEYLSLENISYRYTNQVRYAINNLSLTLKKGDSIAFIGKSGAGKTTLVDVILGLLIPQQGDIKVDGISVYENLRAWQNLVGYIPQSIFLTDDTIKRNIAFGVPDELIDIDKLYQVIEAAQLLEVVNDLPNGVDTRVGERGVLLSGGQRQRVGIARALYHDREILILDEATAALDNETEKLVTDAINVLSGKKTLITIAHRLTTVEKCDRVYQLDKGCIVKAGKYKEVINPNFFHNFNNTNS